ncbi:hypothetical protein SS50377_20010 [Spironucleus salmonicida]|nr:hypothetical protein SS50377_20010 [Spironucleus salmonicida]
MEILGVPYQWYRLHQQAGMPNMKVKPLYTMPTASTQARSTKMWKAQASISPTLFLLNYDIATSLGPDHQLAPSRHPDSHTLADLALVKLILASRRYHLKLIYPQASVLSSIPGETAEYHF